MFPESFNGVSRKFQGTFKVASSKKDISSRFKMVLSVLERNLKGVSGKFQLCFKEISKEFQGSFLTISRKFQGGFKEVERSFQGSIKLVSSGFQGYLKEVQRLLGMFYRCFK